MGCLFNSFGSLLLSVYLRGDLCVPLRVGQRVLERVSLLLPLCRSRGWNSGWTAQGLRARVAVAEDQSSVPSKLLTTFCSSSCSWCPLLASVGTKHKGHAEGNELRSLLSMVWVHKELVLTCPDMFDRIHRWSQLVLDFMGRLYINYKYNFFDIKLFQVFYFF